MKVRLSPLLAAVLTIAWSSLTCAEDLVVVTSLAGSIRSISHEEAERLYLGRTTTLVDNTSVTLIDLPPGPDRDHFYLNLTGKNPVQVRANWSRQVFTGRALPPRQAESPAQVRGWLKEDPSAIGYVPASEVTNELRRLVVIGN